PRNRLPPPTTIEHCTPSECTSLISPAIRLIVSGSTPYSCSPISASPDSLSRIRWYIGLAFTVEATLNLKLSPGSGVRVPQSPDRPPFGPLKPLDPQSRVARHGHPGRSFYLTEPFLIPTDSGLIDSRVETH